MNGPRITWILIATVLVAATQAGVELVRARYEPRTVRPLRRELTDLDSAVGSDWVLDENLSPEDSGIDPRVLVALGTQQALTRQFVNNGLRCSVHIAVWMEKDEWTPHPPELCYSGAGFTRREHAAASLPGTTAKIRESVFVSSLSGQPVNVLYWYQIGSKTYYDRDSARPVFQGLWGKAERPPLVKVLMQYQDDAAGDDRQRVEELAAEVHGFVASL